MKTSVYSTRRQSLIVIEKEKGSVIVIGTETDSETETERGIETENVVNGKENATENGSETRTDRKGKMNGRGIEAKGMRRSGRKIKTRRRIRTKQR